MIALVNTAFRHRWLVNACFVVALNLMQSTGEQDAEDWYDSTTRRPQEDRC
jgi:hypothetical protein